jgi:hypothetical protein
MLPAQQLPDEQQEERHPGEQKQGFEIVCHDLVDAQV